MYWFRNLKMVQKLTSGFGVMALLVGAIGYMGLTVMEEIDGRLEYLHRDQTLGIEYIKEANLQYLRIDRAMRNAILEEDDASVAAWISDIERHDGRLRENFGKFKPLLTNGDDEAIFSILEKDYAELKSLINQVMAHAVAHRVNEARAMLKATRAKGDALDVALGNLVDHKQAQADQGRKAAKAIYDRARNILTAVTMVGIVVALALGYLIARILSRPIDRMLPVLEAVAARDFSQRLHTARKDEFGKMITALNKSMDAISMVFSSITENAATLTTSAEQLSAISQRMAGNAEETAAQSTVVSAASEQVSKNVQTVAAGAEEMSASIKEIAKSASDAARVAKDAVAVADQTNVTITKLGESSAEIGKVIRVITSIAEQTNLLALNATIEAARAGEAGKGFAVVANEVKELAKQTGEATEDISKKIGAIQHDTQGAVAAIQQIGGIINQINDIANTIASAVEEQSVTTNEMSRNVGEAAKGSNEIVQNITGVAQAAQSTATGATQTQAAAQELAQGSLFE